MNIHQIPFLRRSSVVVFVLALATVLTSCKTESETDNPSSINPNDPVPINTLIPKTPGTIIIPADNPMSDAKVELGRHLFFDKALSVDNTTSCGSCHNVTQGFSDVFPTSMGMGKQHGNRNTPALANIAYNKSFTWDGRFKSLEEHAPGPIFNSVEMGNNFSQDGRDDTISNGYNSKTGSNDTNFLFGRLDGGKKGPMANPNSTRLDKNGKNYYQLLNAAWGPITVQVSSGGGQTKPQTGVAFSMEIIAKSIAAFERTIISTESKFDRYNNGDKTAYNYREGPKAINGFKLFTDVNGANCISCHSGYNFTDQEFHYNGIGINQNGDKGRFAISKDQYDVGKFKTPSLRNINLSGPYMHDGRFESLDKVLEHYNSGGTHSAYQDAKIKPLNLTESDISDIIEFLHTLTDNNFVTDKSNKFTDPWN